MKKIWLKNYPPGIPYEIPPLRDSLTGLFFKACREFAGQKAFTSFGKSLTYQELRELSLRLSASLQSLGLQKGEAIAIQLPNILQYPVSLWAALLADLKVVNMNPLAAEREMLHQLKDSEARAIIVFASAAKKLERIAAQTQLRAIIKAEPGDLLGFPKKQALNFAFRHALKARRLLSARRGGGSKGRGWPGGPGAKSQKTAARPRALSFAQALKLAPPEAAFRQPPAHFSRSWDRILFIQYTGGTTGSSKGACLSEGNILSNLKQCDLWTRGSLKRGREKALAPLPLYHIFAFLINGLLLFLNGSENILIANPRNRRSLIKEIKKRPITLGTGVNTLFKALLKEPKLKEADFSRCKFFMAGGMPLEPSVQREWRAATGSPLIEGYGLTEASPAVCCNPIQGPENPGSIGVPLPSTDIRIVDEAGRELPPGEEGGLEVKGPQVMRGYHQRERDTKEAFSPGGWLKTGDIAEISRQGLVKIKGRKKDMINVSGFNVYPAEIEDALCLHPGVREAAVIGVPCESSLEKAKAFVARSHGAITEKELLAHCRPLLAPYKIPKAIEFVDEIPKTILGKPLRRALRNS